MSLSHLNYINYQLPYTKIHDKLLNKTQINIFIDLNSIAKGFYNRTIILEELNYYIDNKRISNKFIIELKNYLGKLYNNFKIYNPKFILFYDTGISQNSSIDPSYKANRINSSKSYIQTDDEKEIYYLIKDYYFDRIYKNFQIRNTSSVIYLDNFETDLIPYYVIKNNFINSQDNQTLNLILSVDKDLLQCCSLNNTYQAVCLYSNIEKQFKLELYDNNNAISYITKSNSSLTSDFIPVLLSLSGDKVDNIAGISGIGPIRAEKLIKSSNMDNTIYETTKLPLDIISFKSKLIKNFKLISFEEQISRLPSHVLSRIEIDLKILGI